MRKEGLEYLTLRGHIKTSATVVRGTYIMSLSQWMEETSKNGVLKAKRDIMLWSIMIAYVLKRHGTLTEILI